MSVRFTEGFDAYGAVADLAERWVVSNSGTGLSLVQGRAGDESILPAGQALEWAAAQITTELRRPLGQGGDRQYNDVFIFGFNFQVGSLPASDARFIAWGAQGDDATEGQLEITPTGTIKWVRDDSTDVATTSAVVVAGAWHHIEVVFEVEDSSGTTTLQIAIDGNNEDFTGSLRTFGHAPIIDVTLGPKVAMDAVKFDDFYMIDTLDGVDPTVRLGETQISTLYPDGDGNTSAWTRFDGSNDWESVDEGEGVAHDGDATYLHSQTTGQQSLFTFGNLDAGISDVDVVAVNLVGRKVGLGGLGYHAVKRSSATTVVDTGEVQRAAVGSFVTSQKVFNTDGLDATWTPTNVDAAEFGMEVE